MKRNLLIVIIVILFLCGVVFVFLKKHPTGQYLLDVWTISTFDECGKSAYPIDINNGVFTCSINGWKTFTIEKTETQLSLPVENTKGPLVIQGTTRTDAQEVEYMLRKNDVVIGSGSIALLHSYPGAPTTFSKSIPLTTIEPSEITIELSIPSENIHLEKTTLLEETLKGSFDPLVQQRDKPVPESVLLAVPFASQAPSGNWGDPFQNACEEAAILMVEYFLREQELPAHTAESEILAFTSWVTEQGQGESITTSQAAMNIKNYFHRHVAYYSEKDVTVENIKFLLSEGYPVIIPAQGQELNNPNFTAPGPPYHMLTIIGFTPTHFITNDPGTRNGKHYKYTYETLMNALHDWTGDDNSVKNGPKAMIVFE